MPVVPEGSLQSAAGLSQQVRRQQAAHVLYSHWFRIRTGQRSVSYFMPAGLICCAGVKGLPRSSSTLSTYAKDSYLRKGQTVLSAQSSGRKLGTGGGGGRGGGPDMTD